jgi:hypothetical protein
MVLLLEIPNTKTESSIKELLRQRHDDVKAKRLSIPEIQILKELNEVTQAKKLAAKVKKGKISSRSAHAFLNEL